MVDCCALTNAAALRRLLFGALHAGSILQLNNLHRLPPVLALKVGEWLGTMFKALASCMAKRKQRASQDENVTLANSSSYTSTPAPPSQKEALSTFEPIPEQESVSTTKDRQSKSPRIHRRSNFTTSPFTPNPKSPSGTSNPSIIRHSLSQQSHLKTDRPFSRSTSNTSVMLDWYQLLGECKTKQMGPTTWFGYGGDARESIEMDESLTLQVSPAFGCVLVGGSLARTIPLELKVGRVEHIIIVVMHLSYFYSPFFDLSMWKNQTWLIFLKPCLRVIVSVQHKSLALS